MNNKPYLDWSSLWTYEQGLSPPTAEGWVRGAGAATGLTPSWFAPFCVQTLVEPLPFAY